ncbi:MAG TPA: SGNH/GDSL hydrolase family protein [Segetibacter sp.]|nr:SGNH/GDSL hydrolase family protein [Segetibacter sp.]
MKLTIILSFCTAFLLNVAFSQNSDFKTWNPALDTLKVLEGQGWQHEVKDFYDRLPSRAEQTVRKEVWDLSENSAGLLIRFRTNADEIIIKYAVAGRLQMPHMPATGVSGIDMYAKNSDGKWLWCAGKYSFEDTITYRFTNLLTKDQYGNAFEYNLYLPLYNTVKWMEIRVPKDSVFTPLPVRKEKPIVVYGTSIAQGGCATRPGLGWTSILSRNLDRPVINLGFSGNGRLEKEVISLIAELDASVFVLDCLPNLTPVAATEVKKRITESVRELQSKRPGIPILLTEHASYTDEEMYPAKKKEYQDVNKALREVFDSLSAKGARNIYLLTKNEINQDIETMVDGVHPNDIGMMRYADAYEKTIRTIMKEPAGSISTTRPINQRREPGMYEWEQRHNDVLAYNKVKSPKLVLIGNSITHYWAGEPASAVARGQGSWKKYFEPKNAVNLGFGWDRIENVLWRVYHGELDGIKPKQIVVMIGTNNLSLNSNEEIITGLQFLLHAIQTKQPASNILLMGILPRRNMEERVLKLNHQFATMHFVRNITYADAGNLFLKKDKKIDESLFSDGLHPNEKGYEKLGEFINTHISK